MKSKRLKWKWTASGGDTCSLKLCIRPWSSSVSKQVDSVLGNMSNTCVSFGFSEEGEYLEDLRGDEEVRTEREGSYVVEDGKIFSLGWKTEDMELGWQFLGLMGVSGRNSDLLRK